MNSRGGICEGRRGAGKERRKTKYGSKWRDETALGSGRGAEPADGAHVGPASPSEGSSEPKPGIDENRRR